MSLFLPDASRIADTAVPMLCPNCEAQSQRDGLSPAEKQYLIDATEYHHMVAEYRQLLAMKAIVDRFPGTQHPLLRGKLYNSRHSTADDAKVSELLNAQPELCTFLQVSSFRFDRRLPFVRDYISQSHASIFRFLVCCDACPQQYLILPEEYYETIG